MTPLDAVTVLSKSKDALVVRIDKDLKLHVQTHMLREFFTQVQRTIRTKSVILIALSV